jgi:hypothetical protein
VLGLSTTPDPARFVPELARLVYGNDPDATGTRHTILRQHLTLMTAFEAALGRLPESRLTLALAEKGGDQRDALRSFLELIGLRLRDTQRRYSVELDRSDEATGRARAFETMGVPLEGLEKRLNAGESINLARPPDLVPVPLAADLWSRSVFKRRITPKDLFAAIMNDPRAALLAHGLAGLDDETLQYVGDTPALMQRLYRTDAPMFAAYASNLRVRKGQMAVPGGASAVALWEDAVGETISQPERFLLALLSRSEGRLVYLYDLISELDTARQSFVLGSWMPEARTRLERFRALVQIVQSTFAEWRGRTAPFIRPVHDVGWMLLNVRVEATGVPQAPADRAFWSTAFRDDEIPDDPAGLLEDANERGVIDAAWLADRVLVTDALRRARMLRQMAFAFRALAASGARDQIADTLVAIRAMPVFPALVQTLERCAVSPAVFAAGVRRAESLSKFEGARALVQLSQLQGALAIVARLFAVGRINQPVTEKLLLSLFSVSVDEGSYRHTLVSWVRTALLPAASARGESDLLIALSGQADQDTAERVQWEGEEYRLSLGTAEERRLRRLRASAPFVLDAALEIEQILGRVGEQTVSLETIGTSVKALRSMAAAFERSSAGRSRPQTVIEVPDLPDPAEILNRVANDLARITRPQDLRLARSRAAPLEELSGIVLGQALKGLAYALVLGSQMQASTAAELSARHDFGLSITDGARRRSAAWQLSREIVPVTAAKFLSGSLLSLDVSMASHSLRRLSFSGRAPVMVWEAREGLVQSVGLINPFSLRNEDRSAIQTAIAKGKSRLESALSDSTRLHALADEIVLDGWRRQAAEWYRIHDAHAVPSLFSLTELLVLGGGDLAQLHQWGATNSPISACLCTRLAAPNQWRFLVGRGSTGALATAVPDVLLVVASALGGFNLPAGLAKVVLGAAMQEFLDRVRPNDPDDWLALVRGAQEIQRDRVADYVAAATAEGSLVPYGQTRREP